MINIKQKGYRATKEVCKMLSEHFGGQFSARSIGQKGEDIWCPDGFKFAPEVKHHKAVRAIHLLTGTSAAVAAWWKQAREQAGKANKLPLLIAKVERHWFVTEDGIEWIYFEAWCEMSSKSPK